MLEWKNKSQGKSALLIEGAWRVGKSFIVQEFAKNEYKSHIIIDFGNISSEVENLFLHETSNLDFFFTKLAALFDVSLFKRESVIVFDEVQQFPRARQLIKYLVADKRYDYIETGSLIRLKKNVQNIIIPSEEEHVQMYPLDFEEFLWALGDETTGPFIKTCFDNKIALGQAIHRKVMNEFRQYVLVGGMPQAVLAYLEDKNFNDADIAKRRIISLYQNDIEKFAVGFSDKVYVIMQQIPGQLSKKEKKFTLAYLGQEARFRLYENSFYWLNESMMVNICFNATDPSVAMALSLDNTKLKCYMADTGLLVSQVLMDKTLTENQLYKAILFDKLGINEGMIMENVVAQMLRTSGHKLFFYSRCDNLHRENHIEIDFVIRRDNKVSPIEVKSADYRFHSSLDKFKRKFSNQVGQSFVLYSKDLMVKDGIVYLPFYMAMFL